MNEQEQSLLVLTTEHHLSDEIRQRLLDHLDPIAKAMGCNSMVLGSGMQVGIHSDIRPLLASLLEEQKATNRLLTALVEALAEDGQDPDAPPVRYLDGSKVR